VSCPCWWRRRLSRLFWVSPQAFSTRGSPVQPHTLDQCPPMAGGSHGRNPCAQQGLGWGQSWRPGAWPAARKQDLFPPFQFQAAESRDSSLSAACRAEALACHSPQHSVITMTVACRMHDCINRPQQIKLEKRGWPSFSLFSLFPFPTEVLP
jgi:hypothetical protein